MILPSLAKSLLAPSAERIVIFYTRTCALSLREYQLDITFGRAEIKKVPRIRRPQDMLAFSSMGTPITVPNNCQPQSHL